MKAHHAMPTRRTLLRTAVWSAPVIAVAAAAPAFAASPTTLVFTVSSGNGGRIVLTVVGGATGLNLVISTSTKNGVAVDISGTQTFAGGTVSYPAANSAGNNQFSATATYVFNFSYDGTASSITFTGTTGSKLV